jgi:hypothetical protein
MSTDFEKVMLSKSDEELQECLDNRRKFVPEAIEAAIAEMQKRGRVFSNEELTGIRQEFQQREEAASKETGESRSWGNKWKRNVVEDENAPAYYSEKSIYMFSIVFFMIFGAILSAINFSKNEDKRGVMEVIGFGVGYTSLGIWILSKLPSSTGFGMLFNIGGALILQNFWKKHIGKDTKYRARPIWKPLIIAIVITVTIFIAAIYGGMEN